MSMIMLKRFLLKIIVKHLLKGILEEDVLRMSSRGRIIYRGKELSQEDTLIIKAQAEVLSESRVLKLILKDIEFLAQKMMFEKSQSYKDMEFGKAILYTVDMIEKKIRNLAN